MVGDQSQEDTVESELCGDGRGGAGVRDAKHRRLGNQVIIEGWGGRESQRCEASKAGQSSDNRGGGGGSVGGSGPRGYGWDRNQGDAKPRGYRGNRRLRDTSGIGTRRKQGIGAREDDSEKMVGGSESGVVLLEHMGTIDPGMAVESEVLHES